MIVTHLVNSIKHLNFALILVFFSAGVVLAADSISLLASDPATIYYTTSGAAPVVPAATTTLATRSSLPEAINSAARVGVKFHLKDARIDQLSLHMGFENQADVDNAAPGEGFQIFTIDTAKLLDESVPLNLQTVVIPTNQWEFLVYGGGKASSLITVYSAGNKLRTSSTRASALAKEMNGFFASWPASADYQYRFIRVYPLADFIELSQFGRILGLFPVSALSKKPDRLAGSFSAKDLLDPQEVMLNLRTALKQKSEPNKAAAELAEDIKNAGEEGLKALLQSRKHDKNFKDLGFDSQDDIDKAELGEWIQIFTINTRKLLDETVPLDFQSLVVSTGQWDLLVKADGKANSLLKVRFVDGKWQSVGIGASSLAKELVSFIAAWPAVDGYDFRYIRLPQSSSDLIELSRNGKILGVFSLFGLTHSPGRVAGMFNQFDLRDPYEVLTELRTEIKQNVEAYKQRNSL